MPKVKVKVKVVRKNKLMSVFYYNQDKLERARKITGLDASEAKVLEEYIKLGGKYSGSVEPKKKGRSKKQ